MLKKRLIFVLLWDRGQFCLSRNFRLQHVGDLNWLTRSYSFETVAEAVDELMLLDVSRGDRQTSDFLSLAQEVSGSFHMPLSVGGGIQSLAAIDRVLRRGADKVVLNSALSMPCETLDEMSRTFGRQCLVASVDVRKIDGAYVAFGSDGSIELDALESRLRIPALDFTGEIVLNNIDRDGTGQGLDLEMLSCVPSESELQIVVMGGVGTPGHIAGALKEEHVDAVATANLLNFVGTGLSQARAACALDGIPLAARLPD